MKCVDSLKYLSVYFKAGKIFIKFRFRSNFYALYSRSKAVESYIVSMERMKSFCMPVTLQRNIHKHTMLDNQINRAVYKMFYVSDDNSSQEIRNFLGLYDVELLYEEKRTKFLRKTHALSRVVLNSSTM